MCSFTEETKCTTTTVINSIVAGCPYVGFLAPGYGCGDVVGESSTNVFKNNVAHSSENSGAVIFPDPGVPAHKTCYQGSHFAGYKNAHASIGVLQQTDEARFSNIISIDNDLGITLNVAGETDVEKVVKFTDSHVWGEGTDMAKNCPTLTGSCICNERMGHMNSSNIRAKKTPHNPMMSARPVWKPKDYSTWLAKAIVENVHFHQFAATTACGATQRVFGMNAHGSDMIPMHYFNNA